MTPDDLAAIAAAENVATPGPWRAVRPGHLHAAESPYLCLLLDEADRYDTTELKPQDARFLAGARTWVPQLLAEVARLRDALEQLRDREMSRGSVEIIEAALRGGEGA